MKATTIINLILKLIAILLIIAAAVVLIRTLSDPSSTHEMTGFAIVLLASWLIIGILLFIISMTLQKIARLKRELYLTGGRKNLREIKSVR